MRTSNIKLTFADLIKCYGTVLEQQSPHQRLVSVVFYWQLGIMATCHVCEAVVKNIHFCLIVSALLPDICIFCWTNFDLTWKYRIKGGVGSNNNNNKKSLTFLTDSHIVRSLYLEINSRNVLLRHVVSNRMLLVYV